MGLPAILKNFNVFKDGESYIGQVKSITLPNLARLHEDYRAGGMDGAAGIDMGMAEKMVLTHTYGGYMSEFIKDSGKTIEEAMIRFAGALQRDDTGDVDALEVVMRGRVQQTESGEFKPGELADFTVTHDLTYIKISMNGEVLIEIDVLNFIFMVDGDDRLAAQRAALGI